MAGRDHIETVGDDDRGGVRAGARDGTLARAGLRMDGFDQAGLADRHVNETGRRIEEGHVGRAGDLPGIRDLSGKAVDLDERAVVASGVEAMTGMVDVEAVRA